MSSQVRIGLLAPLTGPRGTVGRDAVRGAQLAAGLVNESSKVALPLAAGAGMPGLGGATLRIEPGDTAGDPERAATQAVRLVTAQRVAGLVNVGETQVTAVASERTERIGVPFVDSGAPATFLTQRGMDWYFRVGPNDRMLGEQLLSMLQQSRMVSARKLAIVHSGDTAGTDMSVALESLAGEGGYAVLTNLSLPTQASGVTALVWQLRAAAPDAVLAATAQPTDSNALLNGFSTVGWRPPVTMAMGAGFVPQSVLASIPDNGPGVLRSAAWSAELAGRNPVARQVAALYQRRFGAPMNETAARAFSATLVLAQGIDAARSVDAGRVRAALLALEVPGRDTIMPWDGIRFDGTGQNIEAGAVVERLAQGQAHVVFPPELATRS
ncbi:MAG TPA: ABC transporter substrate-binding protein [Actinomycetes bacterium]|nr:ABC transporter substrate-binding protein [Actinomycetes bacterium]